MTEKNTLTKVTLEDSKVTELMDGVAHLESLMEVSVDAQNIEEVAHQLMKGSELLHVCGRLMEIAVKNVNLARGRGTFMIVTDMRTAKLPPTVQQKIVEGAIAEYLGHHARAERGVKNLVHYLDNLRTIISKNKEQMRLESFGQPTS